MSMKCMPIVFINIGGEMVYIIHQRLQAQNINEEKSGRVLSDIFHTMFDKKFVDELFMPREIYSRKEMRMFFEALIHSSIMRLNEKSMDKLYDIITMMFKYQLQMSFEPRGIVYLSFIHLEGIRKILPDSKTLQKLADYFHKKMMDTYANMPIWEKYLIRDILLIFFQDAKVRISILLREKKQIEDGRFVIHPNKDDTQEILISSDPPGSIQYYAKDRIIKTESFPTIRANVIYKKTPSTVDWHIKDSKHMATLGANIYSPVNEKKEKSRIIRAGWDIPPPGDELKLLSALVVGFDPNELSQGIGEPITFINDYEELKYDLHTSSYDMKHIDVGSKRKSLSDALSEMHIGESSVTSELSLGANMVDLLAEMSESWKQTGNECTISLKNSAHRT